VLCSIDSYTVSDKTHSPTSRLKQIQTRSTATVHTSTKARLTSFAISVPPSGEPVWMNDCMQKQIYVREPLSVSPSSYESGIQSLYPDGGPDRHQNLTICSLANCQPSLKISCKSIRPFLRKVANRQTDRQTMTKT